MNNFYLKYQIQYSLIYNILNQLNKKRVNFFIDLQNIARGLYNRQVILMEIGRYATEGKISNIFIEELKTFLNNIFLKFRQFDPFFVIFYDNGNCVQNTSILSGYKEGRNLNIIVEDEDIEIFRMIKKYYFTAMVEQFTKKDISKVFYLEQYESDFIPHFCITKNIYDSLEKDVLNVILSVDKDLLQTCEFNNTIQCATTYKNSQTGDKKMHFGVYDRDNAVSFIYENYKRGGIITAKYIPLILSISGDKADKINGIESIGVAKSCKIIEQNNLPHKLNKNEKEMYPEIIKENFDLIERNFKIISFDEQIKRIPQNILSI